MTACVFARTWPRYAGRTGDERPDEGREATEWEWGIDIEGAGSALLLVIEG